MHAGVSSAGLAFMSAAVSGLRGAGTKAKMPSVPGIVWLIALLSRKSTIQSRSSLLLEVEEAKALMGSKGITQIRGKQLMNGF